MMPSRTAAFFRAVRVPEHSASAITDSIRIEVVQMKSIPLTKFASGSACIMLAASFYAPLSQGAADAPAASPMNPNPTHETVGEGMSDTAITTKVKASLLEQKNLSSMHVHVRTREGVVRLTGSVPSAAEKQMAADVVHGITGVKSVENHLVIHKS